MGILDDTKKAVISVNAQAAADAARQQQNQQNFSPEDFLAYDDPDALQAQLTLQQLQDLQQVYQPFIQQQQANAFDPATVGKIQNDLIGAVDEGITRGAERAQATTAKAYGATPSALTQRQQSSLDRRSALATSQARGAGRQSALQSAQELRLTSIA